MTPADPGHPIGGERLITLCAEGQCPHGPPVHFPLPVLYLGDAADTVLTRWVLSDEERAAVAAGADLWIWQSGLPLGEFPPIIPTFDVNVVMVAEPEKGELALAMECLGTDGAAIIANTSECGKPCGHGNACTLPAGHDDRSDPTVTYMHICDEELF